MSEISLEHLDDLENVYLASTASNFHKPSFVPCLQLELLLEDEEFPYIPMPKPPASLEPTISVYVVPEDSPKVKYADYAKVRSQIKAKIEENHIRNLLVVDKILQKKGANNIEKNIVKKPKKRKTTEFTDNTHDAKISKMIKSSIMLLSSIKQTKELASLSIIHAVLHGNLNYVEAHLDSCISDNERLSLANSVDQYGRKPLHYASLIGDENIVKMLILCGADPCAKDFRNRTALHYSSYSSSISIQLLLIIACENSSIVKQSMMSNNNNFTVSRLFRCQLPPILQLSATEKPLESQKIEVLLSELPTFIQDKLIEINKTPEIGLKIRKKYEKYIDWIDDEGKTALHISAEQGNTSAVKLLIKLGADICIEDNYGNNFYQITQQKKKINFKLPCPHGISKHHKYKSCLVKPSTKKYVPEKESFLLSGNESFDASLM